jgi:membrane-bound lytic murein transglycosylase D
VNPGDFFHRLAVDYNCTVDDILAWNNMRKQDGLFVGQKIIIWVPENQVHIYDNEKAQKTRPKTIETTEAEYVIYTVEAGDTISSIARKFKGLTVEEIIHANDGKIDKMGNIKPGQSLKIPIH